jgi:hypothetical protein
MMGRAVHRQGLGCVLLLPLEMALLQLLVAIEIPRFWALQLALQHVQEPRWVPCFDPLQAQDMFSTPF